VACWCDGETVELGPADAVQTTTEVYEVGDLAGTEASEKQLLETITSSIDRDSWEVKGGKLGSVKLFRGNRLVVTQSPENQEQVVGLLARLRGTSAAGPASRPAARVLKGPEAK
jgi:hypothetical protein